MNLFAIIPRHDPNQALRVKRFLMAGLVYATAIGLMAIYVLEGFMGLQGWLITSFAIIGVNSLVFLVLRSGRNERLNDPSLTGIQMIAACLLMALTLYQVNMGRGALLMLFVVLLQFGAFRLRSRQFMVLGLFALLCYGMVIALVYHLRPATLDLRIEFLQWLALAVLVPCGSFFAGHVGGLRQQLRERQVDLQQAREKAHELAVHDEITGISNRRSIIHFLEQERARSDRLALPLSVCLIDLDAFKRINRQFGYVAGDQVLRRVAHCLGGMLRTVDGLGRYGGEEFLVVMPDTTEESAAELAERLRERVADCRFQGLDPTLRLTLSAGVSAHQAGEGVWAVIQRARRAADQALDAGGNKTVTCSGEQSDNIRAF